MDITLDGGTNYRERYENAPRGEGLFANCAGFAKYMLGLSSRDRLVRPNSAGPDGLIPYLDLMDMIPFEGEMDFDEYINRAKGHDVVGVLVNNDDNWFYAHYAVIDQDDPTMVYQRPDFERDPEYTSYEAVMSTCAEFVGDSTEVYIAFLNKKD